MLDLFVVIALQLCFDLVSGVVNRLEQVVFRRFCRAHEGLLRNLDDDLNPVAMLLQSFDYDFTIDDAIVELPQLVADFFNVIFAGVRQFWVNFLFQ